MMILLEFGVIIGLFSHGTVQNIIDKVKKGKLAENDNPPESLQYTNLWSFNNCSPDYRDELDEIDAIINTNEQRELSKEQKVRVGRKKEWMVKERAKARQLGGLGISVTDVVETFPQQPLREKSRDIIAQIIGFGSGRNYDKADTVVAVIDTLPEDKAPVLTFDI